MGMSVPDPPAAPKPLRARFGRFELDEANASLLREGSPIALAPKPFAVLCALVRQAGALLTKHALLDEVWGHRFVGDSVLKTVISELRTALGDEARQPRFIETVSRRGYRFIAVPTDIPAMEPGRAEGQGPREPAGMWFVGRAEALARLCRAWDCACAGHRKVVWVAGEPGIGKTTLIDHFLASLGETACIRGQCVEHYGSGEPYLPVLEAVAELCRRDAAVVPLLRAVAPAWLLQLPWLSSGQERDALHRELAGVGPDRMLREMGELLDRYTERRPLLLVTEDLHWSDRATVQLIDFMARRRGAGRFMWLASFRLAEVVALDHPLNPLRHELRAHGLCEEIVLDPFSETEVADYVAHCSPSLAGNEAFVRALHGRTDGVPLFVASVMTELMANSVQGREEAAAAAPPAPMAVPENLAAIIDHYIARLGNDQRQLLAAAAVCGVEFRVETVSTVLGRDAAWVAETCDALAREQIWLTAPHVTEDCDPLALAYSFRHALFCQVLYERTPPSIRSHYHAAAGAVLEKERAGGLPVAATQLAMHFERGREPMAALRYYAEAAEEALAHLNPAQCCSLTEHASTLVRQAPAGPERDALELAIATLRGVAAFQVFGAGTEASGALRRAYSLLERVPDHPMRGLLLHGCGFVLCLRAEYADALAVAERAEALWSAERDPVLLLAAGTVQGEVHMLQGRPRVARVSIERALAATASLDTGPDQRFVADPQVTLLGLLAIQQLHLGLVTRARASLQQAYARARRSAQPMARLVALWLDAMFELRLGDAEKVAAIARDMRGLVDRFALAQGRTASAWFQGWADARKGESQEAWRRIRDAYEENMRLGMLAGASENATYAAEARLLAGDPDGAEVQLEEAHRIANAHGERVYLPQLFLIDAAVARARGRSDLAEVAVRRAIAEARAQEAPWLELNALVALCELGAAACEERHMLATLVDQLPEAAGTSLFSRARAVLERGHGA